MIIFIYEAKTQIIKSLPYEFGIYKIITYAKVLPAFFGHHQNNTQNMTNSSLVFRPEMLKFNQYSILTGDTRVEFVIYCVFTLSKKNLLSHLYWGAQVSIEIS